MDKGKSKITGLKAPKGDTAKGSPKQAIIGNTLSKSSVSKMTGGKKGKMLKAKGK